MSHGSITYWVAWTSSWPMNIGIAHIVPRLTWRRAWCDPPLALGGPSQACTCPCLSPWRVMCWDMRRHTISSRRAVPRDWWTICCLDCGRCKMQTKPMAWSRLPWFPTSLSLTPWPFAMARRWSVHGTLRVLGKLRLWRTTCLPWARELRPWLKCDGC